tara:strand:- start:1256 stop:1456 length:201 start_codon:yes stop_codon:yes gene_type:complete
MNTEKRFKKIIIISSPSGAGKTTICKYLLKKIKKLNYQFHIQLVIKELMRFMAKITILLIRKNFLP